MMIQDSTHSYIIIIKLQLDLWIDTQFNSIPNITHASNEEKTARDCQNGK